MNHHFGFIEIDDVANNSRIQIRAKNIQVISPKPNHEDAKAVVVFEGGLAIETSLTIDEIFDLIAEVEPSLR